MCWFVVPSSTNMELKEKLYSDAVIAMFRIKDAISNPDSKISRFLNTLLNRYSLTRRIIGLPTCKATKVAHKILNTIP